MNSLVKELIQPLLEETTKTVAIFPGKFKPPHKGHFEVAKQLLNMADEVIVVISRKEKDGITAEQSKAVWELYNQLLNNKKLKIEIATDFPSPLDYLFNYIKTHPEEKIIAVYGKKEESRYNSLIDKPNVEVYDGGTVEELNARDFRKILSTGQNFDKFLPVGINKDEFLSVFSLNELEDYEVKYWAIHADIYDALKKDPNKIYNFLKTKLTGERLKALEYFYNEYFMKPEKLMENCGCMHTQQPMDFRSALASLTKHMMDQGYNISPLPKLRIISDDVQNAENILGKTAYYDPNNCSITLYTLNRHPKDVLRSYSHEMIHRIQDNEGRLNNVNTTNTNEDSNLQELEKEAYLNGNIIFRNWEDSIKNV